MTIKASNQKLISFSFIVLLIASLFVISIPSRGDTITYTYSNGVFYFNNTTVSDTALFYLDNAILYIINSSFQYDAKFTLKNSVLYIRNSYIENFYLYKNTTSQWHTVYIENSIINNIKTDLQNVIISNLTFVNKPSSLSTTFIGLYNTTIKDTTITNRSIVWYASTNCTFINYSFVPDYNSPAFLSSKDHINIPLNSYNVTLKNITIIGDYARHPIHIAIYVRLNAHDIYMSNLTILNVYCQAIENDGYNTYIENCYLGNIYAYDCIQTYYDPINYIGGHDQYYKNLTLFNPKENAIAITNGYNLYFENLIIYNTRNNTAFSPFTMDESDKTIFNLYIKNMTTYNNYADFGVSSLFEPHLKVKNWIIENYTPLVPPTGYTLLARYCQNLIFKNSTIKSAINIEGGYNSIKFQNSMIETTSIITHFNYQISAPHYLDLTIENTTINLSSIRGDNTNIWIYNSILKNVSISLFSQDHLSHDIVIHNSDIYDGDIQCDNHYTLNLSDNYWFNNSGVYNTIDNPYGSSLTSIGCNVSNLTTIPYQLRGTKRQYSFTLKEGWNLVPLYRLMTVQEVFNEIPEAKFIVYRNPLSKQYRVFDREITPLSLRQSTYILPQVPIYIYIEDAQITYTFYAYNFNYLPEHYLEGWNLIAFNHNTTPLKIFASNSHITALVVRLLSNGRYYVFTNKFLSSTRYFAILEEYYIPPNTPLFIFYKSNI